MSKPNVQSSDFLITNPDEQPGIVLLVEPGVRPVCLLDGYYSDKLVRCSFCRQRQKHRKGIFALLPDGSKALCGHCCAVEFTSKATVAGIEREVDRKIQVQRRNTEKQALLLGLQELVELIDHEYLPKEKAVNETLSDLADFFPSLAGKANFGFARAKGGLVAILSTSDQDLTGKRAEEILKKRRMIDQSIRIGLEQLQNGVQSISLSQLKKSLPALARPSGCESAKFEGNTLVVSKWESVFGDYDLWETEIDIPDIEVPDPASLLALLYQE